MLNSCSFCRPGKQIWEKKWAVLKDNSLHLYTDDTLAEECNDAFDLCPSNGITTVHSAVTAAELTNTASSDLPYILRLEYEPDTTCWPGRWVGRHDINGLVQERCNFSAVAMELRLSCIDPSICI